MINEKCDRSDVWTLLYMTTWFITNLNCCSRLALALGSTRACSSL